MKFQRTIDNSKAVQHLGIIGKNDAWETPRQLVVDFCKKWQIPFPQLDVACTSKNKVCKFGFEIDKGVDGLHESWKPYKKIKVVFCNPPYSGVEQWIRKALYQHQIHNLTIILLTFNKTDTGWFHELIKPKRQRGELIHDEIHKRVKFLWNGKPYYYYSKKYKRYVLGTAPYPSTWFLLK